MVFPYVEELIADSQTDGNKDLATMTLILGFALMMTSDVNLG